MLYIMYGGGPLLSSCFPMLIHFRFSQHCFSLPGPPYLGLSRQYLQTLQSDAVQPEQVPQRFLVFPLYKNVYQCTCEVIIHIVIIIFTFSSN